MTEEELWQKLPPYWFFNGKKRKRFFNNLNSKFKENLLKNTRKKKILKKISFQLNWNEVKRFNKTYSVVQSIWFI